MLEKKLLNAYAKLLLNYSLEVKKDERVGIYAGVEATPLVEELYAEILKLGAHPFLRLSLDNQNELFFNNCSDAHLTHLDELTMIEAKKMDCRIRLMSSVNTREMTGVDPAKQAILSKTMRPVMNEVLKKDRWVLSMYPTQAYAQDAEMPLSKFEEFIASAVKINFSNPVKEWQKVYDYQERIIKSLKNADEIHILGEKTDLKLSVKNRKFINSCGKANMPSGEVFTGPVENSANGEIYFEFPACTNGYEVSGIILKFKNGKVVEAKAQKNEEFLLKMIDMDKGARFLGEFAFGLNYSIQQFTKNILFDEKIGGTIHLALGNSYPETGGKNKSGLHWDMIKDLRKTGEVKVNGKTVFKKGKFQIL